MFSLLNTEILVFKGEKNLGSIEIVLLNGNSILKLEIWTGDLNLLRIELILLVVLKRTKKR